MELSGMKIDEKGSVDSVPGFSALGVSCGIKQSGEPDLAVVLAERPCAAAAVYTTSRVQAAPLTVNRRVLEKNSSAVRAIVVNSGNANACTGGQGIVDAEAVLAHAERILELDKGSVLGISTGVVGVPLPVDRISDGLEKIREGFTLPKRGSFARAIMTTDTREKSVSASFELGGRTVTIGAAAKGSGMIHPDMATMLAFLTTDAGLSPRALRQALAWAVDRSFNMISVDGDRSPNDSVYILASGTSGAPRIEDKTSPGYEEFREALLEVTSRMARAIVADGEGATKLVEIRVTGARSFDEAARAARAVANSPLVKTAVFGGDPNWGRIICAVGYSGVDMDQDRISLWFGDERAVKDGVPAGAPEERLAAGLAGDEVKMTIDLGLGGAECTFLTCDFSYDYVKINADYRT